jgi:hypothetical protein
MGFTARDLAGYTGKETRLYVKTPNATKPNDADVESYQIRGAQNFNPTVEKSETKVSELGYEAQKVIYGTTSYSVSTSLLVRDLVQIARLSGLNPNTATRLNISDFSPVNCINWIQDPNTPSQINATVITTGFKARTSSTTQAVESNNTITLDGSADCVVTVDGKATVREHVGDGACTMFAMSSDVTSSSDVYSVEYPAGQLLGLWDGYTYVSNGVGGVPNIKFNTAPDSGAKIRIIYKCTGAKP